MSSDAKKNDQGKLRYDLIPPECLKELAHVYTLGSRKYADDNWKNGLERHRIEAALMRHAEAARAGEARDPEDGQRHYASVAWCAFALMWYDMQLEKDDEADAQKQVRETGEIPPAVSNLQDEVAKQLDKRAADIHRQIAYRARWVD